MKNKGKNNYKQTLKNIKGNIYLPFKNVHVEKKML
jgi:hypothetical protein